jgi:triosephosphate isomerase
MNSLALFSLLAGSASAFTVSPSNNAAFYRPATDLYARKPFISGNWKLNPDTKEEAIALGKEIAAAVTDATGDIDVALFVPYVFIEAAKEAVGGKVSIGAEGVCPEISGAFTGAVSAPMLKSVGVEWVLAGHSERRTIFGETDDYINGQCLKLIENGMKVMLCIGESESEYEQNLAGAVCAVQLKKGLAGISKEDMDRVVIAYEPVWAIGTGKVATPETAQDVHAKCRAILAEMYDRDTADATRILYGGSVSPGSVDALMSQPDIDGGLVGGASLDGEKFSRIINFQPL